VTSAFGNSQFQRKQLNSGKRKNVQKKEAGREKRFHHANEVERFVVHGGPSDYHELICKMSKRRRCERAKRMAHIHWRKLLWHLVGIA